MMIFICYEIACLSLFISCFCRLVLTDHTTDERIRLSIFLLSVTSLAAALAPHYGWAVADWPTVLLVLAFNHTQFTTGRLWRGKVPQQFTKSQSHAAQ